MTWLKNKEINYSTPSLSPSVYVCGRAHTCIQKESVTHLPNTHPHKTKQNKTIKEPFDIFSVYVECEQSYRQRVYKYKNRGK